jgi:hypothetical protein
LIRTGGLFNSFSFSPRQVGQRLSARYIRTTHLTLDPGYYSEPTIWTLYWSKFLNDVRESLRFFVFLIHTAAFLSLYLSYVSASELTATYGPELECHPDRYHALLAAERRDSRVAPLFFAPAFPKNVAILNRGKEVSKESSATESRCCEVCCFLVCSSRPSALLSSINPDTQASTSRACCTATPANWTEPAHFFNMDHCKGARFIDRSVPPVLHHVRP